MMKSEKGAVSKYSIAERMKEVESELTPQQTPVVKKTEKISKPQTTNDQPTYQVEKLLSVSGTLKRTEFKYISKNLSVSEGLLNEINKYCAGNDLSVLNYLLHLGLDQVKASGKITIANIASIESIYTND